MNVPFMNLKALHEPIKNEIENAIREVIECCAFAGGTFVETFENEFAEFCQCDYVIGVGSGTDALYMALRALGIGAGDEVITVPNTFIATAEAISFCGATPVFVDIDERNYTINPELIEPAITSRTKAIVPVHIFGQMADMNAVMSIAQKYGLFVVEDACQAHGAKDGQKHAGTIGDAGCFSFYPGKNLGALGEAGAVTTNNQALAEKIRALRDHGQHAKYEHAVIGCNGRMDGIQGAVLSVKLKYLGEWNERRRQNAQCYGELLSNAKTIRIPIESPGKHHVYHIYSVRVPNRKEFMAALGARGISCGVHYPVPVHRQKAYLGLGKNIGSFPVAEQCSYEFVSLPMCPKLSTDQVKYVSRQVMEAL